ncbi:GTP cyclohydrolase II [Undibacterium sp. LX40W]|uniref:GTP cyclohydrolase-2 n=1 Tax=Undibacterium nitidum TaxID=2762298 RepID=A0A923HTH6_9BURK|nr:MULTISPECIES: GTP cyclohydrolase II [Undibacterium]MBC3880899.1 GTP cyclohydrolase II [Undibacterium nitidum]MBC3890368.1 GTP cyclohydrolase II [Undibacterium sp. LX40W]
MSIVDLPLNSEEQALEFVDSCDLPTTWARFRMHGFVEPATGKEHVALTLGDVADGKAVLARIHSECLTGDALFSQRCDCGPQLEAAMQKIAAEGRGVILYLRQEGRGIGLLAKIRAYHLQDDGADTVEANQKLGFAADLRNYSLCDPMLKHLGISSVKLMTNNPRKISALQNMQVKVEEHVPLIIARNQFNQRYLETKAAKLGHMLAPDL